MVSYRPEGKIRWMQVLIGDLYSRRRSGSDSESHQTRDTDVIMVVVPYHYQSLGRSHARALFLREPPPAALLKHRAVLL
jgi:hypothetical protein